jgi:arylsulfatase
VLVAQGGRFGGFSLHVVDGCLEFAYNFAGVETTTLRSAPLVAGRRVLGVTVAPSRDDGPTAMRAALVVDDAVGEAVLLSRTTPIRFTLHGEGLTCGYTDGTPVTEVYRPPFAYPLTIHDAVIDTSGAEVIDVAAEIRRAFMIQ